MMMQQDNRRVPVEDVGLDAGLESFMAAGRAVRPDPSDDLMARIMTDAFTEMPAPGGARPSGAGLGARIRAIFGGWGSMGGLVAATLAGVWIGFDTSGPLAALTTDVLDATAISTPLVDTVELMPEFDDFFSES